MMENIRNKMIETLKEVVNCKEVVVAENNNMNIGDLLEEYGFDANRNYSKLQMYFVDYAIKHCHGLKNKIKAAVALFVVDKIVKYIIEERPSKSDLGCFCYDILEDCKIIRLALSEED